MKEQSDIYEYPLTIKEHHLDTFGHVNNATYLQIFEEARWDFITRNGYGLAEVMREKKGPVILEVSVKFRKELANRQAIVVKSYCTAYRGKVGKVYQSIENAKGETCCLAEFTFAFFDLAERKLIAPTPEWIHAAGL